MELPLRGTFEGTATLKKLQSSPVQLRLMQRLKNGVSKPIYVGKQSDTHWVNLGHDSDYTEERKKANKFVTNFSGVCLQFGLSLLDRLGADAPPIGLIQSPVGGSLIEEWASVADLSSCKYTRLNQPVRAKVAEQYFNGMIAPMVNMTLRGWVYYQGENNVLGAAGNR